MDLPDSNLPSVVPTYSDEKSNNAISHNLSVKSYATKVFQESTIGIVSSILTTHSNYRRFFKVFISSLCVVGFIYHCVVFLNHVLEYPEVVNISPDKSEYYNLPAYTYCPNNPINRSIFCGMYPQHCVMPSKSFCKKYSSYCGANATLRCEQNRKIVTCGSPVNKTVDNILCLSLMVNVPKKEYQSRLPMDFQYDWILKLGSEPNVLNVNKSNFKRREVKADEISGPYVRISGYVEALKPCHIIHSLVESNQRPLQKQRVTAELRDELFYFYVNETEMMNPRDEPGVYFAVHSPFEIVNPFKKGIFLKGGTTYGIHVEMKEEVLLKAPFHSNCMDYEELWKNENRTGPRTRKMCEDKCSLEYNLLRFECVPHENEYPHNERICGDGERMNFTTGKLHIEETQRLHRKCSKKCRIECRSSKYKTEYYLRNRVELEDPEEEHRHIRVEIYLSNEEVKVLRHSPKYETVDVISSVGGFMGCWLGIALMDILDVFGSIITVGRYAFRKTL